MFSKNLASSRGVIKWLVCLVILILSGCSTLTPEQACREEFEKRCEEMKKGGVTIIPHCLFTHNDIMPVMQQPIFSILCKNRLPEMRGANELFEKVASSIVVVTSDNGKKIEAGAVISSKGHILTSQNVVADANNILVFFLPDAKDKSKKSTYYAADRVFTSAQYGLALLKLREPPQNLKALELSSIGDLKKGQTIHTMGHSKAGNENWVYSEGLVSDVIKDFKWTNPVSSVSYRADIAVQTQTPINPGTAGAFLFDDQGKLAGMFVSSDAKDDRINYAISAKVFTDFIGR